MIPNEWKTKASTYIGVMLIILTLIVPYSKIMLFPLSILVCIYGVTETLQREIPFLPTMLSLLGHIMLPLLCLTDGNFPPITIDGLYTAILILLITLSIYVMIPNSWPYKLNVQSSIALMCSVLLLLVSNFVGPICNALPYPIVRDTTYPSHP